MKMKLLVIGFIALLLISSMYVGLQIPKEEQPNELKILTEVKKYGRIMIDCVKVNTIVNFSEVIEFASPENTYFVEMKWDFDGDNIIDWKSRDSPYYYLDGNRNKIYATYRYNQTGLYKPSAVCLYYNENEAILYKIYIYVPTRYLIVYSEFVNDYGDITLEAVDVSSPVNFSDVLRFFRIPENASFIYMKWDFEGDGVIDWVSYDSPYYYVNENGNRVYAIHKYNQTGLYGVNAVCTYYNESGGILYKIFIAVPCNYLIVYSDTVNASDVLNVMLKLKKNYVHLNNTTSITYIGWTVSLENIGNVPLYLLYLYGSVLSSVPGDGLDVYMITPEGNTIAYRPLILPSSSLLTENQRDDKDYLILYPNETTNKSGIPFGVGNAEDNEIKQFEWYYVNNNTTYHFKRGTYNYTVYFVIYNVWERWGYIPTGPYGFSPYIIENLSFPTGTLITNKVNITISID